MKKKFLLLLTVLMVTMCVSAQVSVCGVYLEESGQVNSPFITSGTVTWDATSHTLMLDNAVIEYSSNNPQDGVSPIRVTNDATIVVQGNCKLTTTGHMAIALNSNNSKNVTIKGNGTLSTSSSWIDIFLVVTHLTIQDITLNTVKGISNNAEGNGVALTFDNVQATIMGEVMRIGDGITFKDCSITYPEDAYIDISGYGYGIYYGNHRIPDKIIISRNASGTRGDVNGDHEVTVADINVLISIIMGGAGDVYAADVNSDGEITIADVNTLIDIILGGSAPAPEHEFVDLGLPSGTMWATCNVGASKPEDYGDYFAWGEIAPKEMYNWSTYKWCNGSLDSMTKYCIFSNSGYNGFTDGKRELDPEDDAATVNWGSPARMPSLTEIKELINQCSWEWTKLNGVNGQLVTGPNGNSIFLPAPGYYTDNSLIVNGSNGFYWSSTLGDGISCTAVNMNFDSSELHWEYKYNRYYGFSVRPVRVTQN